MDETQIANEPDQEALTGAPGANCSNCCQRKFSTLARAIVYIPMFVLIGGMSAIAMYPELAEYAAPLLPEQTHSCNSAKLRATSHSCSATSCSTTSGEDLMVQGVASPIPTSDESSEVANDQAK